MVPERQCQAVGKALIAAACDWARAQGCSDLASDTLLANTEAAAAHLAAGFEETEQVVYFRRPVDP